MLINGFTAQEWHTIKQALQREVRTLEAAQQAVTSPALQQMFEDERREYIRLSSKIDCYYLASGGNTIES